MPSTGRSGLSASSTRAAADFSRCLGPRCFAAPKHNLHMLVSSIIAGFRPGVISGARSYPAFLEFMGKLIQLARERSHPFGEPWPGSIVGRIQAFVDSK